MKRAHCHSTLFSDANTFKTTKELSKVFPYKSYFDNSIDI